MMQIMMFFLKLDHVRLAVVTSAIYLNIYQLYDLTGCILIQMLMYQRLI